MDSRRVFIHVAEAGTFTAAARTLGLARTTVMRRVAALEAEVGLTLIQRAGNRVVLTQIGHRLVADWRALYRGLDRAEEDARLAAGRLAGTLRLWLPVLGTGAGIIAAVADFSRAQPDIEVRLQVGHDPRALETGDFDVAMQLGYAENPELMARTMFRVRMLLVASPAYLDRWGTPESEADLRHHRCVQERDPAGRVVPWQRPDGTLVCPPPVAVSANAVGHVFGLAVAGAGIARVPDNLAGPALADGRLRCVLPHIYTEDPLSFVYLPDPAPTTRAFLDYMSQRARQRRHPHVDPVEAILRHADHAMLAPIQTRRDPDASMVHAGPDGDPERLPPD